MKSFFDTSCLHVSLKKKILNIFKFKFKMKIILKPRLSILEQVFIENIVSENIVSVL